VRRDEILHTVERYYSGRLAEHGTTARGVDWNSDISQRLRFTQLLKVCGDPPRVGLIDYGCGYGALVEALIARGWEFDYQGFDISRAMLEAAQQRFADRRGVRFVDDEAALEPTDVVVASGVFNVKLEADDETWKEYIRETLDRMAQLASRGLAFNVLTTHSDPDRRRPDLFYGDPVEWTEYCRRRFSRYVALLHNYPLYEFTILVNFVPVES
jgi:cyclopropane fatty-acyl-phospholipid synthase-like methyltransferase